MTASGEILLGLFVLALLLLGSLGVGRLSRKGNGNGATTGPTLTESGLFARRIMAAGLTYVSPPLFVLITLLFGLLVGLSLMEWLAGGWPAGLVGCGLTWYIVYGVVREVGRHRANRFEERLADAVGFLAAAFEAGEGPMQAIDGAAGATTGTVSTEFRVLRNRLQMGTAPAQAFSRMVERYDSEGVRLFANAMVAKMQTGGDMAPMLRSVANIIRERVRHRLRLRSQLGGARLTAVMAGILPYVLLLVLNWIRPEWIQQLLLHPAGPSLLFVAICLQIVGFLWLQKLTDISF